MDRYGLVPPVDVLELARSWAELELAAIPGGCDGLVVGLHGPRPIPLILVEQNQPEVRQRFTAAHEIGHVLLPWHVAGNFVCNPAQSAFFTESYYAAAAEAEANRFAAELLVPTGWLGARITELGRTRIAPLMDAIATANVSSQVACLRLLSVLPAGYVFAVLEEADRVVLGGQTRGTGIHPSPKAGIRLDRDRLDRFAADVEEIRSGSRTIVWWTFVGHAHRGTDADTSTADELEYVLLSRHASDQAESDRIRRVLAGVLGSAYSNAKREEATDAESLNTRFRSRFARKRDLPIALLQDDAFGLWLRRRADDLAARADQD